MPFFRSGRDTQTNRHTRMTTRRYFSCYLLAKQSLNHPSARTMSVSENFRVVQFLSGVFKAIRALESCRGNRFSPSRLRELLFLLRFKRFASLDSFRKSKKNWQKRHISCCTTFTIESLFNYLFWGCERKGS